MAGLPTVPPPRRPLAGLPGRHPLEWARLLAVWALVVAAALALVRYGDRLMPDRADDPAAATADPFSALAGGYDGPPVRITVEGNRTKAPTGLCVAIVRDASSSVSSGIDPDGQVNDELASISEAFATGSLAADRVVGVVFAAEAKTSGAVAPGDADFRSTLLSSPGEDGTSISAGLRAAATSIRGCASGTQREVILVSDGDSGRDDIEAGLGVLPDETGVHLVALDGGSWTRIAPFWGVVGTEATIVRRLDAGVVALAVNRVMSELTGQNFTTGFDTEGPGT